MHNVYAEYYHHTEPEISKYINASKQSSMPDTIEVSNPREVCTSLTRLDDCTQSTKPDSGVNGTLINKSGKRFMHVIMFTEKNAPLHPKQYCYVVVDVPAHGKSGFSNTSVCHYDSSDSFVIDMKNPRIVEVGDKGYEFFKNAKYPPNPYALLK